MPSPTEKLILAAAKHASTANTDLAHAKQSLRACLANPGDDMALLAMRLRLTTPGTALIDANEGVISDPSALTSLPEDSAAGARQALVTVVKDGNEAIPHQHRRHEFSTALMANGLGLIQGARLIDNMLASAPMKAAIDQAQRNYLETCQAYVNIATESEAAPDPAAIHQATLTLANQLALAIKAQHPEATRRQCVGQLIAARDLASQAQPRPGVARVVKQGEQWHVCLNQDVPLTKAQERLSGHRAFAAHGKALGCQWLENYGQDKGGELVYAATGSGRWQPVAGRSSRETSALVQGENIELSVEKGREGIVVPYGVDASVILDETTTNLQERMKQVAQKEVTRFHELYRSLYHENVAVPVVYQTLLSPFSAPYRWIPAEPMQDHRMVNLKNRALERLWGDKPPMEWLDARRRQRLQRQAIIAGTSLVLGVGAYLARTPLAALAQGSGLGLLTQPTALLLLGAGLAFVTVGLIVWQGRSTRPQGKHTEAPKAGGATRGQAKHTFQAQYFTCNTAQNTGRVFATEGVHERATHRAITAFNADLFRKVASNLNGQNHSALKALADHLEHGRPLDDDCRETLQGMEKTWLDGKNIDHNSIGLKGDALKDLALRMKAARMYRTCAKRPLGQRLVVTLARVLTLGLSLGVELWIEKHRNRWSRHQFKAASLAFLAPGMSGCKTARDRESYPAMAVDACLKNTALFDDMAALSQACVEEMKSGHMIARNLDFIAHNTDARPSLHRLAQQSKQPIVGTVGLEQFHAYTKPEALTQAIDQHGGRGDWPPRSEQPPLPKADEHARATPS